MFLVFCKTPSSQRHSQRLHYAYAHWVGRGTRPKPRPSSHTSSMSSKNLATITLPIVIKMMIEQKLGRKVRSRGTDRRPVSPDQMHQMDQADPETSSGSGNLKSDTLSSIGPKMKKKLATLKRVHEIYTSQELKIDLTLGSFLNFPLLKWLYLLTNKSSEKL